MRNTYKLTFFLFTILLATACTKYGSDVNLEENQAKQDAMTSRVQEQLAGAANGWLLLVPSLDTAIKTAMPVLLQFDRASGTFRSRSPYPASGDAVPTLYEVSSATGVPLLSFATGSIFSGWYESGGITDYYFKVLELKPDTITIQPYRKGNVFASEGGIPMKMIRQHAPLTWFDNPVDLPRILTANTSPFWNSANNPLLLNYRSGYTLPATNVQFDKHSAGNLSFIQGNVPFCRFLKPYPIALFPNRIYSTLVVYYCGNNALITHIDNNYTPDAWFVTGPRNFSRLIQSDYLLVRSVNAGANRIELFAVDANGNEIITGTLEVQ